MERGTLAANFPAPTIVLDEGDEFYLNLTNVAMVMRPDLVGPALGPLPRLPERRPGLRRHPGQLGLDQPWAATLSYYYKVTDCPAPTCTTATWRPPSTCRWACSANLYVRAKQDRCLLPGNGSCPPGHVAGRRYAYNDGDGSTRYDVDYPIQIGSFDPDFHDASFGVQPLPFAGMRTATSC